MIHAHCVANKCGDAPKPAYLNYGKTSCGLLSWQARQRYIISSWHINFDIQPLSSLETSSCVLQSTTYKINNFSRAMSSTIWAGPGKSTSRHSSLDSAIVDPKQTDKYLLQVTAGPSYDESTHKVVNVNSDEAIFVENDLMACWIKVRIRDYHGIYHSTSRCAQPDRERLESCDS